MLFYIKGTLLLQISFLCVIINVMKQFSIEEAVKYGWKTTKENFVFFLKILLAVALVYILSGLLQNLTKDMGLLDFLATVAFWVLHIVLDIGLVKIALKFVSNQKPDLEDLYNHYPLFWKYLGGSILAGLIVAGGLILLIVPGIIFAIRLEFVSYLIIDKEMGPMEAIKESWRMTSGNAWRLFLMGLLLGLINILGALALGIGLLWTIPTTGLATAFVYKKLLK